MLRHLRQGMRVLVIGTISALLMACATDPMRVPLGADKAQVLQRLGNPSAQYHPKDAENNAERLQYSWQPFGQRVFNIDLNAQSQVVAVTQALDEALFPRIEVDHWTRDDVLREFGAPAEISGVYSFDGEVWTWRYQLGPWNRLLHVYIDPQGVVRKWHPADEPQAERREFFGLRGL